MKKTLIILTGLLLVGNVFAFSYSISQNEMRARCLADGGRWVTDEGCKCPSGQRYYGWSTGCGREDIAPWDLCHEKYGNWKWDNSKKGFTCECQKGWAWDKQKGCYPLPVTVPTLAEPTPTVPTPPPTETLLDSLINMIKGLFGWS